MERRRAASGKRKRRASSTRPGAQGERWASWAAWLIFLGGLSALGVAIHRATRTPVPSRIAIATPATPRTRATPPRARRAVTPRPTPAPSAVSKATPAPALVAREPPVATPAAATGRSRPFDLLGAPPAAAAGRKPRLAIIIDDVGADLAPVERAMRLPYRLTFAVIPHLQHSRRAAQLLNDGGYEVILHLPMEALDPRDNPGAGAVRSDMGMEDIRRTVLRDLAAVPHIRGVNNHMGSRITSDRARMRTVLETLAATPYFFIDSRTADTSVAFALARELRIPSAERSVFLDDVVTRDQVRGQLAASLRLARQRGHAIAIGHPHAPTLDVLAAELPRLVEAGVELVFASELVS